jgi:hypothetical protein
LGVTARAPRTPLRIEFPSAVDQWRAQVARRYEKARQSRALFCLEARARVELAWTDLQSAA